TVAPRCRRGQIGGVVAPLGEGGDDLAVDDFAEVAGAAHIGVGRRSNERVATRGSGRQKGGVVAAIAEEDDHAKGRGGGGRAHAVARHTVADSAGREREDVVAASAADVQGAAVARQRRIIDDGDREYLVELQAGLVRGADADAVTGFGGEIEGIGAQYL